MKSMVLSVLRVLAIPVFSLWLLNKINIFSYLSFVPKDNAFDIGITIYFAFFSLVIDQLIEHVKNNLISELTAVISVKNIEKSIENTPIIYFSEDGLAEAELAIKVNGKKKHFMNTQLLIPAYKFATMQLSPKSRDAYIDSDGNLIIDLDEMFSEGKEKYRNEVTIHISFIKEPYFSKRDAEVKPEFKRKSKNGMFCWINFACNTARLMVKE